MHYKHSYGFTLIELLIVVAIIAILAAIAVPNFLEAQIRTKISKTKNDLRAIGGAITAYEVDNVQVPLAGASARASQKMYAYGYLLVRPYFSGIGDQIMPPVLTTPIAYMSAMPADVFNQHLLAVNKRQRIELGAWYTGFNIANERISKSFARDPSAWPHWGIYSCGPDHIWVGSAGSIFYDPTNGTVSGGDIAFWQGRGFWNNATAVRIY